MSHELVSHIAPTPEPDLSHRIASSEFRWHAALCGCNESLVIWLVGFRPIVGGYDSTLRFVQPLKISNPDKATIDMFTQ